MNPKYKIGTGKFISILTTLVFISSCASSTKNEVSLQQNKQAVTRGIASIEELDACYEQAESNNINSRCQSVIQQENLYVESKTNAAVDNELTSDDVTDYEKLANEFNLDKRKKSQGLFSGIRQARKEYKEFKTANPNLVVQAKNDFKKFKKELRKNPSFAKQLKTNLEQCEMTKNTPESKQCAMAAFQKSFSAVVPKFSQNYYTGTKNRSTASDDSSGGTCSSGGGMNPETHYHLILIGKNEVYCDAGTRVDRIYGPGAYIGWYNSVYVCTSNPQNTTQAGLTAGGAALLGAATSLTFGGAGVCLELAFNFGAGAYAGIVVSQWQ